MAQRAADPPWPWLITMSSSCYEYGSSLRFSFSETLPCRMARVLSLSLSSGPPLLLFLLSPISISPLPFVCLSFPLLSVRPSAVTWPTLRTQRTNTAKRVAVYTVQHAVRQCEPTATGGARSCVSPSLPDRHHFFKGNLFKCDCML